MKLSKLLESVDTKRILHPGEPSDPEIGSVHYDTRNVEAGGLFVAVPGFSADGSDFADDAISRGAVAVVTQNRMKKNAIVVEVEDARKALGDISCAFYGHPSEKMIVVGVTGTNGKTTTAFLLESIFTRAGFNTGLLGTIICRYAGKEIDLTMTTPESADLQRILADMAANGVTHVIMEVSSHAIELHRVRTCRFDVGVFTNLTRDHLDFHEDMESYWECKKRFFTDLLPKGPKNRTAVVNCNDPRGKTLSKELAYPTITVGFLADDMVRPVNFKQDLTGNSGTVVMPGGSVEIRSFLVGEHNLENILCAAGVCVALDIPASAINDGLDDLKNVPGRLERIARESDRFVYIDYAHTPDALENVLASVSVLVNGRIICVFGCGGDRDVGKRPQMGEIACKYCDLTVVTSDNPRSEQPMEIINQILPGIKKICKHWYDQSELENGFSENGFGEKGYVIQPDRRKAIRLAIKAAREDDVVVIAGKGHENYQLIGGERLPFDDRKEAEKALAELE